MLIKSIDNTMVFDFHNDFITGYKGKDSIRTYIFENAGVKTIFAVFTTELNNPLKVIKACDKASKKSPSFLYGIEDLGFTDKKFIRNLNKISPFYCSLTWNYENILAGGCNASCGLKHDGREMIRVLNEQKIVLDTAHLNEESFYDCIDLADNVICSHTGLKKIKASNRNITFEQISLILDRGGIVGLSPVASFMTAPNVLAYVDSILCYYNKFGVQGLVIGTDFFGAPPILGFVSYLDRVQLYNLLKRRGLTEQEIRMIFFENAYNYVAKIMQQKAYEQK